MSFFKNLKLSGNGQSATLLMGIFQNDTVTVAEKVGKQFVILTLISVLQSSM